MAEAKISAPLIWTEDLQKYEVQEPIAGEPAGKNLLTMRQIDYDDIMGVYLPEAAAAEKVRESPKKGIQLLQFHTMQIVMRQPSTRTANSMKEAMDKLGGSTGSAGGQEGSSEAKGESLADSWEALASSANIIGTRTEENGGPKFAAQVIARIVDRGKLPHTPPVINLGDGTNEHPTQALGDLFTVQKRLGRLEDLIYVLVGDQERYRAFHSLMLGILAVGGNIIAVQSEVAPVPQNMINAAGDSLSITDDLDDAMRQADVLYLGRNPHEYTGDDPAERLRYEQLTEVYRSWRVDNKRIQQMSPGSIVMHPRPRGTEENPDIDADPRAADVELMYNLIPMRMAIIAVHSGVSIKQAIKNPYYGESSVDHPRTS